MQFVLTIRLAFIALLLLGLSACGGSGSEPKPSPTPAPSSNATSSSSTTLPVTQNFAFYQIGPFNLQAGDVLTNQAMGDGSGTVSYISSNTAVATVDASGLLNVVGAGDAVITATKAADSKYLAASASYSIHATSVAQTFSFAQAGQINLSAGDSLTNPATGQGSGAVTYNSSNTAVATVDGNGVVSVNVVGSGSTVISATKAADPHYNAATASYTINATGIAQTLTFAQPGPISVMKDASFTNTATGQGTAPVVYSSNETHVAVVNDNGQVTVVGAGIAIITATTAADNRYLSATNSYFVYSQTIQFATPGPLYGYVGGSGGNSVTSQGGGALTYTSSDPSIASVSSNGLVTFLGEGHAVITLTKAAYSGYLGTSASYEVNISRASQTVTFSQTGSIDVLAGDTLSNQATAQGTGPLTYSSSDTSVATVDSNGLVTVTGGGSAVITATVAADAKYLGATANYNINASIAMTAWVGTNDTLVSFPATLTGLEFYRSSNSDCDLANYLNCSNGQVNVLNGATVPDSAATLNRAGYYVLKNGVQQATLTLNSTSGNPPTTFPFKTHENPQTIVFNNKLWMIGGYDRSKPEYKNDIWSSSDGLTWKQEVANAGFSNDGSLDLLVFNNRLWLFVGSIFPTERETWSSADGINWVKEASNMSAPISFDNKLAVFNNKIWLVSVYRQGGIGIVSEVWSTADGKTWTFDTTAAFPAREHATLSVFNNELWLIGGFGSNIANDIWTSSNGVDWVQKTANANFPARWKHTTVVYNNKLWLIGGADHSEGRKDIWSSADGITWTQELGTAPFNTRSSATLVTFDNRLMMFGGYQIPNSTGITDVWSSLDGIEWRSGHSGAFQFKH